MTRWLSGPKRVRQDARADEGVAMVVVLGVMMVGAIITATLAYVTMFSTQNTLENRVEARAVQSADAGLDLMLSLFEDKTYDELYQVCSQSFVINNDQVDVATSYTVVRGGVTQTVACPLASDITTSVTVTSKATTAVVPLSGGAETRTVAAVFAPTPPTTTLDKAIFSESSLLLTNNAAIMASGAVDGSGNPIMDANIYSNGDVDCKTQTALEGSIYAAQGKVNLENSCDIATTVWARDSVHMTSTVDVRGDIYSASSLTDLGNPAVLLGNSNNRVWGSVVTNGSVKLTSNPVVNGSVFSRIGAISMDNNGANIGGSAYARTDLYIQNGASIGRDAMVTHGSIRGSNSAYIGVNAWASGTIQSVVTAPYKFPGTSMSYPNTMNPHPAAMPAAVGYAGASQGTGAIQPPPREQMPQLFMGAAELQKWQDQGWNLVYPTSSSQCTKSGLINYIDSLPSGPNLIFFEPAVCPSGIQFQNADLTLKGDLALVSPKGIESKNPLNVRSDDASIERKMFWIMPADSPGVTWVSAPSGQLTPTYTSSAGIIKVQSASIESVEWFIYTPTKLDWSNGIQTPDIMKGQIYAKDVNLQTNFPLQMSVLPVPSLSSSTPNLSDPTDIRMSSRFDVRG
ncbi:hypothetical protein LGT39_02255 [Demequina sp. TTPB684]|uniref:hypothetical protein n=1 Tax=unclassified Demequina TaxID=2620311 RepID=UPI001CF3C395|nr:MULTISPECIES: hypothetical protein [unclassified Demequina]MCB2411669.1 hypothetical protein [Demequina sp. TTPB684]UPU89239.1 hypothetical protein LGT36_004750 [Demequina sp. TMPB413]